MSCDFSKGSVGKHILRQAVPLTIAQMIQLLYNVVDRVYIGHLEGTNGAALTGLGIVFPILTIISAFTNLFASGGAPLFSIARGAGERQRASRILNCTFSMLCSSAVVLTIVCYLFRKPVLYAFGASDATYVYADSYLAVYLTGTVFSMLATGMVSFVNALGFPKRGMFIVTSGAVVNMVLDPLFIFVLGMGVRGAALATVLSQFLSAALVLDFFVRGATAGRGVQPAKARGATAGYRLCCGDMKPDLPLLLRITGLGMSGFIMAVTNSIVQVVCSRTLRFYGGDLYVGVMTVLNSVREIANVVVVGISNGAQPVISFNYGAGEYKRVKRAIFVNSVMGIGYTTLFWAATMMFPGVFIRMFSDSAAMYGPGIEALKLYFFGFFFMAFQFSGQSAFVSLGKSRHAVFFSLFRKVVIVVPLTLLLPKLWSLGVKGVFLAEPVSNAVGGLACFLTMTAVVGRELKQRTPREAR